MHLDLLSFLRYGKPCVVRDGDVSLETDVDVVHHLSEYHSMGRGVLDVVVVNVIVYHLMYHHILKFLLVQFIPLGEIQGEVSVCSSSILFFFYLVPQLSEIAFGMANPDPRQRELAVEAEDVELVEDTLYVSDGNRHGKVVLKVNTKGKDKDSANGVKYKKNLEKY